MAEENDETPVFTQKVQEAFDAVTARMDTLDEGQVQILVGEVDNYDPGLMADNLAMLAECCDEWLDEESYGDCKVYMVVAQIARDLWEKAVYAKLTATCWAAVDIECVRESIVESITDTGGECLGDTRIVVTSEDQIDVFYEHGGWWVTHTESGAQWSAHDVGTETSMVPTGWDFERVSDGEFE